MHLNAYCVRNKSGRLQIWTFAEVHCSHMMDDITRLSGASEVGVGYRLWEGRGLFWHPILIFTLGL